MIKIRVKDSDVTHAFKNDYSPFEVAVARTLNVQVGDLEFDENSISVYNDADELLDTYFLNDKDLDFINSMYDNMYSEDFDWKKIKIGLKRK